MNRRQTGYTNAISIDSRFAPLNSDYLQEQRVKSRNDKRKRQESAGTASTFRHSSSADSCSIRQVYSLENFKKLENNIDTILDGMKSRGLLQCSVDNIEFTLQLCCTEYNPLRRTTA
ncbi:hypothetical protein DPMN_112818 [Dreissena polymorpha]|uniref:Uncharacterized protein n=1 Tax=Dreissena polymorpha TaxID=45954 RepID=A0A9D4KH82_DREPO|nr:hypothetical protein DPMN_112818 [Dreissena polymorpha]